MCEVLGSIPSVEVGGGYKEGKAEKMTGLDITVAWWTRAFQSRCMGDCKPNGKTGAESSNFLTVPRKSRAEWPITQIPTGAEPLSFL